MADATIEIGEFRLDPVRGVLSRGGDVVPLRAKTFAFLCHLAQNRGRVVSKDELFDAVWPNVHVSEDSLTHCASELRKALGLGPDGLLRTIPKRGYLLENGEMTAPVPGHAYPSIAILPFRNRGPAGVENTIIDGMVEEITFGLARYKSLTVIAPRSAFVFAAGDRPALADIGSALGAEFIVEGAGLHAHGRLALSVTLTHAASGQQVWGSQFDFAEGDLFSMNAEIAATIISRLVSNLDRAVLLQPASSGSLAAFESFTRGVAFLRGYGPGVNERARELFARAIEIDPDFALAHAYLALTEIIIADYAAAPREILEAARDRVTLAITLEPEESRCYRIMGLVRLYLREHEAAERYLRRAHELNPYDADALAQLGFVLAMRGHPVEGVAALRRAIALNPFRPFWYDADLSYALYGMGAYEEAAELLSSGPDLGNFRHLWIAASYSMAGRLVEAGKAFEMVLATMPAEDLDRRTKDWTEYEHEADLAHLRQGLRIAEQAFHARKPDRDNPAGWLPVDT